MGFRINTNINAMIGLNHLNKTNQSIAQNYSRLSSGLRINKAADDAAGLAVSETIRAQLKSLNQAIRNGNDGVSLIQTAEGSLNEIQSNLIRLRELSVQSSSGTVQASERPYINTEAVQLINEIERLSAVTQFNGQPLLNGASTSGTGIIALDVQVGIFNTSNDRITLQLSSATSRALSINTVNLFTSVNAQNSIASIDSALNLISNNRALIGAIQNRLGSALNGLASYTENLSAAESQIRDVDFASETAVLSKNQVLLQAGVSVLSQANNSNQSVLSLLQQ